MSPFFLFVGSLVLSVVVFRPCTADALVQIRAQLEGIKALRLRQRMSLVIAINSYLGREKLFFHPPGATVFGFV